MHYPKLVNHNLRIAIVDDEKELTDVYSMVIRKLGYPSPSVFVDGTSIVKALAKGHLFFDVIIMDYRMPEMNGIEAAKIIQRHRKQTKIVLASGLDSVKQEALAAGLTFLGKPFSKEQLARYLEG
jgi:CheY-like chemotaxis protein